MEVDFESDLTVQQQAFVAEYVIDFNQKRAALKAGYSEKSIASLSSHLISNPKVKKAIAERLREIGNEHEVLKQRILNHLSKMAFNGEPDHNSLKATELLGKHLAMFTDKVENSGTVKLEVDEGLWSLRDPAEIK
jgi:phage terminase small subunit